MVAAEAAAEAAVEVAVEAAMEVAAEAVVAAAVLAKRMPNFILLVVYKYRSAHTRVHRDNTNV